MICIQAKLCDGFLYAKKLYVKYLWNHEQLISNAEMNENFLQLTCTIYRGKLK